MPDLTKRRHSGRCRNINYWLLIMFDFLPLSEDEEAIEIVEMDKDTYREYLWHRIIENTSGSFISL